MKNITKSCQKNDRRSMKIRKFMQVNRKPLIVLAAVITAGLVGLLVYWLMVYPKAQLPERQNLPPVEEKIMIEPTDYDWVINSFGPWENNQVSQANNNNMLVLREDGSILRSTETELRRYDQSWRIVLPPPEISKMSVEEHTVKISTNKNRDFAFNTYQAFVLAQTPSSVYIVDNEGKISIIDSRGAEKLKIR